MKKLSLVLAVLLLLTSQSVFAGLVVTPTSNAGTLTNTILGPGITVVGTPTYTGASQASGTFSGGASAGIGIESGIILTSGSASAAVGSNKSGATSFDNGFVGNTNLTALIPGYNTHDASTLKFDFTTVGGDLFFNYAFASEEYNEWVGSSYNDVFGFFLDGKNIALIPGTTTPVSINKVNLGSNSGYYNNNANSPYPFDIEYDGFTDVFTVTALNVGAGIHSIELAIADAGDWNLDSAVFIQGGTFSDKPPETVPEPGTMILLGAGLVGLAGFGRKKFKK